MHQLDDDMEELFQRAAGNYPLKPATGEWEQVQQKLHAHKDDDRVVAWWSPARKITALVLLLLLTGALSFLLLRTAPAIETVTGPAETETQLPATVSAPRHSAAEGVTKFQPPRSGSASGTNQPPSVAGQTAQSPAVNAAFSPAQTTKNIAARASNPEPQARSIAYPAPAIALVKGQQNGPLAIDLATENALQQLSQAGNLSLPAKPAPMNGKKFYLGIAAGPDYSWVKNKMGTSPGLNVGLIAGYQVNARFSVETGIAVSRKNYASEGSNFSMDKMGSSMPVGMTIMDLSSSSNVLTIPLRAKYNLSAKRNGGFYLTGGVATYIYTKETNAYNVMYNGAPQKMDAVYNQNKVSIPAVAQAGIGYQKKLAGNLQLRVEPYASLPLTGMGIGGLHVSGAGINIGLLKKMK